MVVHLPSGVADTRILAMDALQRQRLVPVPYELKDRLVIGVASSALFDLSSSDLIFREQGEAAYRRHQDEHIDNQLAPGVAFPFIKRLLGLNDLGEDKDPPVEVIVLSKNDPDTGLRVMRSIASHGLDITRAVFTQGRSPYAFMPAFNMSLFLSHDADDVRRAVEAGLPAGQVLSSVQVDDPYEEGLRIAFDFDGVLADDSAERINQTEGIEAFHQHEFLNRVSPQDPGPLQDLLVNINRIQQLEVARHLADPTYRRRVFVSIVTARSAPSHERAVTTLKDWGVMVNDAFFLGGIDKGKIVEILRPHIYFDDQSPHLLSTSQYAASVHIPYGVANETAPPKVDDATNSRRAD